jgi:hypothetical protein
MCLQRIEIGSLVRVQLYSGDIVTAQVVAVIERPSEQKVQVSFGSLSALVDPEQVITRLAGSGIKA